MAKHLLPGSLLMFPSARTRCSATCIEARLTLSDRLIGHQIAKHLLPSHLVVLPLARSRLPTPLIEPLTAIIPMDEERTCKSYLHTGPELRKASDCSPLCIQPTAIIKQSSYPTASGGLGDVYKCTWNRDAGLDEVSYRFVVLSLYSL